MDTIFYKGSLKRGKEPAALLEKLKKDIKKKGPTAKWEMVLEGENRIILDFHDEKSESFLLEFGKKNVFEGFCKIAFEPETDGQFEALFDMLFKAKSFFKEISFEDDYGLAENYWNSKQYKFVFRELTEKELYRVQSFAHKKGTSHEEMLRTFMAEDMGMSLEEFRNYVNPEISIYASEFPEVFVSLENYIYETASFGGERLCDVDECNYYDLGSISFSVFAFMEGLSWVFWDGSGYGDHLDLEKKKAFSQKDAQVGLLFREKFAAQYQATEDALEKLVLVYRYFLSVYDYLGFHFEGKEENRKSFTDRLLEQYGEEKGERLLTCYCTAYRYVYHNSSPKVDLYRENLEKNITRRYGEDFWQEYQDFVKEFQFKMRMERVVIYYAESKTKYIEDALVL